MAQQELSQMHKMFSTKFSNKIMHTSAKPQEPLSPKHLSTADSDSSMMKQWLDKALSLANHNQTSGPLHYSKKHR